ncbi:MAG TPA: hypothetical protein VHD59_07470 [Pseudolabrys sp.]|jgi:hypothetical protein|nr:hypothetical protein [Pseudolabrys sp.]
MSSKAEEYRKRAEEAEEWAKGTTDSVIREKFEEIARQWRELIASTERKGGLRMDVELPSAKPAEGTRH